MTWSQTVSLVTKRPNHCTTMATVLMTAMLTLCCASAAQHFSLPPQQALYAGTTTAHVQGAHRQSAHVQPAHLQAVFRQQATHPMMLVQRTTFMQPLHQQQTFMHPIYQQQTYLRQPLYQQQLQLYQRHSFPLVQYVAPQQQYHFTSTRRVHSVPASYGTMNNHKASTGSGQKKPFVPYNYANTAEENKFYARTGDVLQSAGFPYDPTGHGDPAFSFHNQG